jgi:hypothetical protein
MTIARGPRRDDEDVRRRRAGEREPGERANRGPEDLHERLRDATTIGPWILVAKAIHGLVRRGRAERALSASA